MLLHTVNTFMSGIPTQTDSALNSKLFLSAKSHCLVKDGKKCDHFDKRCCNSGIFLIKSCSFCLTMKCNMGILNWRLVWVHRLICCLLSTFGWFCFCFGRMTAFLCVLTLVNAVLCVYELINNGNFRWSNLPGVTGEFASFRIFLQNKWQTIWHNDQAGFHCRLNRRIWCNRYLRFRHFLCFLKLFFAQFWKK